jgi:MFS family permease
MLGDSKTAFDSPIFVVPEMCSICFFLAYVLHTRRALSPIIPLHLLRDKGFAAMNALTFLWGVTGFGVAALVPLYAEQRYHLGALSAATLLTARGVGATATGIVAALLLRRTGYRIPMIVGYAVVSIGTLLMSFSPKWGLGPYAWLSIAACATGLGNGIGGPASRNATLHSSPEDVAAISGLRQMFLYIGIIFSVSTVSAVLARSSDPGLVQSHVFWVVSAILVAIMIPLVFRVPEHKGGW